MAALFALGITQSRHGAAAVAREGRSVDLGTRFTDCIPAGRPLAEALRPYSEALGHTADPGPGAAAWADRLAEHLGLSPKEALALPLPGLRERLLRGVVEDYAGLRLERLAGWTLSRTEWMLLQVCHERACGGEV